MFLKLLKSITFAIIILLIYIFLFMRSDADVGKDNDKYKVINNKILSLEANIENIRAQDNLELLLQDVQNLKSKKQNILNSLAGKETSNTLLQYFSKISSKNDLRLVSFESKAVKPYGFYNELPVEVSIRGSYKKLLLFFEILNNTEKSINIRDFIITGPVKGSNIIIVEAVIFMSVYSLS